MVDYKTNLLIGPKINRRCGPAGAAAPPLLRWGGGGAGEGGVAPVLRWYHAHLTGLWKREGKAGVTHEAGRLVVRVVYRGFTCIIHGTFCFDAEKKEEQLVVFSCCFYSRPVPEFIAPVFAKTSTERSFSVIENELGLWVIAKTGSINWDTWK